MKHYPELEQEATSLAGDVLRGLGLTCMAVAGIYLVFSL